MAVRCCETYKSLQESTRKLAVAGVSVYRCVSSLVLLSWKFRSSSN